MVAGDRPWLKLLEALDGGFLTLFDDAVLFCWRGMVPPGMGGGAALGLGGGGGREEGCTGVEPPCGGRGAKLGLAVFGTLGLLFGGGGGGPEEGLLALLGGGGGGADMGL